MKGLYLNVPGAANTARAMNLVLEAPGEVVEARTPRGDTVVVSHHAADWPSGAIFSSSEEGIFAAASGWILSEGRFGDLPRFARAAAAHLRRDHPGGIRGLVDAGAFTLFLVVDGSPAWITDPFGLHPHYVTAEDPFRHAAPAPSMLAGNREPDPGLAEILEAQNHLFGDFTAWKEILRITPGQVIENGRRTGWFEYTGEGRPEQLPHRLVEAMRPFGDRPRVLPLSGGLDSRLLLATGDFDLGYTFGPERSGDRPVARRFRRRFSRYLEFSLLELEFPERLRTAGREILRGTCPRPFAEMLVVHRHVHANVPRDARVFDGYLGDVLKRGTYLTSGGMRGSMAKLLPSLTLRGFDSRALLRRRYAAIGERGFERLEACYSEFERLTPLGDPHRLMLFEILHGRGARYTLNGGTLLAGQYFSVVQPYFLPAVFHAAFPAEVGELLAYRVLRRIWKEAPQELGAVRTYSGFRPTDHPTVSRLTMLATKGLARLGVRTRAVSYEDELPRVRWS